MVFYIFNIPKLKAMNQTTPKTSVSFFGLICATIGHDYVVTRKVTNHINEYKCSHCGREVTDNHAGNIEALTNNMREINSSVADFFQKRTNRLAVH